MPRQFKSLRKIENKYWLVIVVIAAILVLYSVGNNNDSGSRLSSPPNHSNTSDSKNFNKSKYPIDRADSPWVVVNKGRQLPANYVPANLKQPNVAAARSDIMLKIEATTAIEQLFNDAKASNIKLAITSAYRSYSYQRNLYDGYLKTYGKSYTDATSARPGHSEHQTGLAADVEPASGKCRLDICFGDTAEGKWLAANAYRFGFIIRYQKAQIKLTGYSYEPWHIRYVGQDLAQQIQNSGQTLEQFFDLPVYLNYSDQPLILQK